MESNSIKTQVKGPVRLMLFLLVGFILLLPGERIHAAAGSRIYVKVDAAGRNDGTSWANAYTSLQAALSAAASGDEIWVAAGTYYPGTNKTSTFQLRSGVALYGGFTGAESDISQRDPMKNITTLSGDIGVPSNAADNIFHVVTGSGTNNTAVLDGFVITAGNALADVVQSNGGGILNLNGSPTLSSLVISGNAASYGGGMYSSTNSSPVLTDIIFRLNTAERAGGMYNTISSNAILTNVTFDRNSADLRGGGMFTSDSSPVLTNVTFHGNTAPRGGGLHNLYGGNPILVNVTFNGNSSTLAGGAIYNQDSSPVVINSILYNDTGGEIFDLSSTPVVSYSIVQGGYGTDNLDVDPLLGPLQDNGGFTETMALAADSPALDIADSQDCPLTDQHGISRPQGAGCDIGAYELDYVAPSVIRVTTTAANRAYGIGDLLTIRVAFSETVQAAGVPQITLETGSPDRTASYSGGSGTDTLSFLYTVQVGDLSSNLDYGSSAALELNGGWIKDPANNHAILTLPVPGEAGSLGDGRNIVIDGIAPTLVSFTRHNPAASLTNEDILVFRATFSEAVSRVDAADFVVSGGTTAAVMNVSRINAFTYEVRVSGGDLAGSNGVIGLDLSESQDIEDVVGNALPPGEPSTDEQYSLDNTPPVVLTIARAGPDPSFAGQVMFNVSFTEAVSGIDQSDFTPATSGISGAAVTEVHGSGSNFTVMVATGSGNGTIRLDLVDDNTIVDAAGNPLGGSNPGDGDFQGGETYTINKSGNVSVTIGAQLAGTYDVPSHGSARKSYGEVNNGPVRIFSTSGIPVIASERINLKANAVYSSYSEVMGLPASKLSDTYIFPWYNNTGSLDSQLRFANVGNAPTTVTIKIGGVVQPQTYTLAPHESTRVSYSLDSGPVEVKSSGGVPIIAALRVNLKVNAVYSSYSEMLGLSAGDIPSTRHIFPWYNNTGLLDSQLRFGNAGNRTTTVTVRIGGIVQPQTYTLAPSQSARVSYSLDNGPVEVVSSDGVPLTASMRINLKSNPAFSSYTELMGLAGAALTDTCYLFPWYNNTGLLDSQLRIANAGSAGTVLTIRVAGVPWPVTYPLGPHQSIRVSLPDVNNGPVEVSSSDGVPILAALRINLKSNGVFSSYYEFMGMSVGSPLGFPGDQLSTTYWFPWYNNTGLLDSQLRFGVP